MCPVASLTKMQWSPTENHISGPNQGGINNCIHPPPAQCPANLVTVHYLHIHHTYSISLNNVQFLLRRCAIICIDALVFVLHFSKHLSLMCVPCLTIHSLTVSACWHTLRAACLNCSTWETTILADSSLCCSKHTAACYSGAAAVTRLAAVTGEQQANTCEASPFSFNCFGRWQRLQYSGCQLIKCWFST